MSYVAAAVIWTIIIPIGVPRFFIWLLTYFKVPQMARLKIDNAWLCEAVKEAWARGLPQPFTGLPAFVTVQTIETEHLEALYALLVKGASAEEATDIMSGAAPPVAENEVIIPDAEREDGGEPPVPNPLLSRRETTRSLLARASTRRLLQASAESPLAIGPSQYLSHRAVVVPPPPTKLQRLLLLIKAVRVRISAYLHPGGKNAARLLKATSKSAARRAFLLDVILAWCKHSGELSIPVVDWEERDAAERDDAVLIQDVPLPGDSNANTPRTPSSISFTPRARNEEEDAAFEIRRYGLRVADLPKLQRRALRQCGCVLSGTCVLHRACSCV